MRWLQTSAAVWAVLAGVSVTLQLGGNIALNSQSEYEPHMLRCLYVSQGQILLGACWLALFSIVVPGDPPQRPQRLWYTFGGIVTLPSFVATPAAQVLGLQLVLMLLLLGMVGAALVFDSQTPRVHLGRMRSAGLALLFFGVAIELLDAVPSVEGSAMEVTLYIFSCVVVGVLFALQSKMNVRLARDLGSPLRSAAWCNITSFSVGVWMLLCLRFGFDVQYQLNSRQWWIWLLVGLQSAFYTLTLTLLPKILGYSSMFVLVLAGKLGSSAMADTLGAFQTAVPLSFLRCASVCTMLFGAVLYTLMPVLPVQDDDRSADGLPKTLQLSHFSNIKGEEEEDSLLAISVPEYESAEMVKGPVWLGKAETDGLLREDF